MNRQSKPLLNPHDAASLEDVLEADNRRLGCGNGKSQGLTPKDGVTLTPFNEIQSEPVEWAWRGRIAAKAISLLVGEPGLGKSTIALDLSAKWSTGLCFGDWLGVPIHTVIASCEDSPSTTLRPRLEATGADLGKIHFLTLRRDGVVGGLLIPDDLGKVRNAMESIGARALIIDPVVGHLGNNINSYRDADVRKALAPLAQMAEGLGAVVLGIAHLNKKESGSIVSRVGGSIGFTAVARSVLLVGQDPESEEPGENVLVHAKSNLAPHAPTMKYSLQPAVLGDGEIETVTVCWGDECDIQVSDVLHIEKGATDQPAVRGEAKDWLQSFLQDGPKPSATILSEGDKLGFSRRTIFRAKKGLCVIADKCGFGDEGMWSWRLPDTTDQEGDKFPKGVISREAGTLKDKNSQKPTGKGCFAKSATCEKAGTLKGENTPKSANKVESGTLRPDPYKQRGFSVSSAKSAKLSNIKGGGSLGGEAKRLFDDPCEGGEITMTPNPSGEFEQVDLRLQ